MLKKNARINRWQDAMLVLGVSLCLIGSGLMFDESILGENTKGLATVAGIIGIGTIARARKKNGEITENRRIVP